jgi:hypothetical protein
MADRTRGLLDIDDGCPHDSFPSRAYATESLPQRRRLCRSAPTHRRLPRVPAIGPGTAPSSGLRICRSARTTIDSATPAARPGVRGHALGARASWPLPLGDHPARTGTSS